MKSIKMALLASTLILGMGISAEAVSVPAMTTHHTDNTRTFEQGKLPNVPLKVGATFKQLEALEPKAKMHVDIMNNNIFVNLEGKSNLFNLRIAYVSLHNLIRI